MKYLSNFNFIIKYTSSKNNLKVDILMYRE
jgi:hypothetical protein